MNVLGKIRLKLSYKDRACLRMTSKALYVPFKDVLWKWIGIATIKKVRLSSDVGEGYVFYQSFGISGIVVMFIPAVKTVKLNYIPEHSTLDVNNTIQTLIMKNAVTRQLSDMTTIWTVDVAQHSIVSPLGLAWTLTIESYFNSEGTHTSSWKLHKPLLLDVLRDFFHIMAYNDYIPSPSLYHTSPARIAELTDMFKYLTSLPRLE